MERRHYLIALVGISVLSAGCLSSGGLTDSNPNCPDLYRDATISQIDESDQDSALNMAGQITQKAAEDRWVLISDGTGVARVDVANTNRGTQLMNQPESKCIEFNAIISNVVGGGNTDVTMYYGGLVNSNNS